MPTVPSYASAPDPPCGFRGAFFSDPGRREAAATVSGPIHLVPAAVAVPADAEDVAALTAWGTREGIALVPRGGGTGMPGGNVGWGVVVDLSALARLGPADQDGEVLEAGPGVTGAALEHAARAVGRFFPPLPSSADRCTVGGMVANNAAGARTFRYGAVRPWVEALDVVLADGTFARLERGRPEARFSVLRDELLGMEGMSRLAWPEVRKNSSGYALDAFLPAGDPVALLVGSEGTLGIVTGARLRLAREPETLALAALPVLELDALDLIAAEGRRLGASACEFFGRRFLDVAGLRSAPPVAELVGSAPALTLLEVDGGREEVAERLEALADLARRLGVPLRVGRTQPEMDYLWHIRHAASPVIAARAEHGLVSMQFIEDSVVPDGCLNRYLSGLDGILQDEGTDAVVFGHAGDGNVHVNPLVDVGRPDWRERVGRILERTVELVASLGGTLSGEHGDGRIRASFHERIFGPDAARAFRAVKTRLDPSGVLNPGVVVSGADHDPLLGLTPRRRSG
ncbi:MAG: FAD-binding oxidoreductase [Longimicrobiales bacterium]